MDATAVHEVTLMEPLTELTAMLSVDIFDGNLFVERVMPGQCGTREIALRIAGPQRSETP